MKRIVIIIILILVAFLLAGFSSAEAAVIAKGKPLAEFSGTTADNSDTANKDGDTANKDGNTANKDGDTANKDGDTANKDGDTANKDGDTANKDGNTANKDGNTASKDGNTANKDGNTASKDGDKVSPNLIAGARKAKESKVHFFEVENCVDFIDIIEEEEGLEDKYIDIYLLTAQEVNIKKFIRAGEKLGLKLEIKKFLKEKDIPSKIFNELTSPWPESVQLIGVHIEIMFPNKKSVVQKIRNNPIVKVVEGATGLGPVIDIAERF